MMTPLNGAKLEMESVVLQIYRADGAQGRGERGVVNLWREQKLMDPDIVA